MEMDMNLGVIMVKISRMDFFMVADNVHSYSYRLFPVIRKDSFRGHNAFFWCQDLPTTTQDLQTNQKLKNQKKSVMKICFLQVVGEVEGMEW